MFAIMQASQNSIMTMKSYRYQAEVLVKDFLTDPIIPYVSVFVGIFMCKMAYDIAQYVSIVYFKGYQSLSKIQRIEWNNRGMSSGHAIFITSMSVYFVFFSDLFSDNLDGLVTHRSTNLSTFSLGVSAGYFISDILMIFWLYPSLGGMEYILHHFLSLISVSYTILSGEGQLYTFMVLVSEATTPEINMRWFLETSGLKGSRAYFVNGIAIFLSWLVARIFLFIYLFYHIFRHYNQIKQMHMFGQLLAFVVPFVLGIMNMIWFTKIVRGVKKALNKRL